VAADPWPPMQKNTGKYFLPGGWWENIFFTSVARDAASLATVARDAASLATVAMDSASLATVARDAVSLVTNAGWLVGKDNMYTGCLARK
jgi:hypothetical protein